MTRRIRPIHALPDGRDAEIAALKAELAALKERCAKAEALAAQADENLKLTIQLMKHERKSRSDYREEPFYGDMAPKEDRSSLRRAMGMMGG
jgi:hypothetical protein